MNTHFQQMNHACRQIQAGTSNLSERDQLIVSNYRIAVSVANRYLHCGLPLEDLIGFAYIGLTEAADRFDSRHGSSFASFATLWCVKEVIQGLTDNARPIRLPIRKQMLLTRVLKARSEFASRHDREADIYDLAETTGITPELVSRLLAANDPFEELERIIREEDQDADLPEE